MLTPYFILELSKLQNESDEIVNKSSHNANTLFEIGNLFIGLVVILITFEVIQNKVDLCVSQAVFGVSHNGLYQIHKAITHPLGAGGHIAIPALEVAFDYIDDKTIQMTVGEYACV